MLEIVQEFTKESIMFRKTPSSKEIDIPALAGDLLSQYQTRKTDNNKGYHNCGSII